MRTPSGWRHTLMNEYLSGNDGGPYLDDTVEKYIAAAQAEAKAAGRAEALASLGFDTLRAECLATYMGGYYDPKDILVFRHGMETVCNVVDAAMKRALATPERGR